MPQIDNNKEKIGCYTIDIPLQDEGDEHPSREMREESLHSLNYFELGIGSNFAQNFYIIGFGPLLQC